MGKDLEEIVVELKFRLRHYRDAPYCRGVWDGAMMVIAHYDPELFQRRAKTG
ncbi:hypothetical protein [Desulfofundulus thermocisternus]|uniref:hypothetical protein n=1 Tax=Desulfofundulus thermocisternus TaxID=42471 RepID=UPI0019E2EC09|nr:hypothetical protein [Desulfofundulus thermocisternus]MBE3586002.1 hypothetical protein [Thermoanaerobacter sp.]